MNAVLTCQAHAANTWVTRSRVPNTTRWLSCTRRHQHTVVIPCTSSSPGRSIQRGFGSGPVAWRHSLPLLLNPPSIPPYSCHGAHMDHTTGKPTPGRPGDSCRYLVATGALLLGSPGRVLSLLPSRMRALCGLHPACPPWRRLPMVSNRGVSSPVGSPERGDRVGVGHRFGARVPTAHSKAARRSGPQS